MDAHIDARYHAHEQDQPDDAGKLITVKAVRSVWRGPVGKRSRNVTFVGWLPYGEAIAILNGQRQKVQFFVMHLCYSRRTYAACFPSQNQESFLWAHVQAFRYFGGVPHRISYDNLATAVKLVFDKTRKRGRSRQEARAFTSFRSYYLFESHFCQVAKGNEKGGVEGSVLCRHLTPCGAFVHTKNRRFGVTEGASEPCESGVSSSITSTIFPLNS